MSAGLPGLGLGGLFFIVSALFAPFVELARTLRGQSSREAWRRTTRQLAQAVSMIVAVDLTLRAAYAVIETAGLGEARAPDGFTVLPLLPIAITATLLAIVLLSAKGLELASRLDGGAIGPSLTWPSRSRVLGYGAASIAAFSLLMVAGASELSTLSGRSQPRAERAAASIPASASRSDGGDTSDATAAIAGDLTAPSPVAQRGVPAAPPADVRAAAAGQTVAATGEPPAGDDSGGSTVGVTSPTPPGQVPAEPQPPASSGQPAAPGQSNAGGAGSPASAGPPGHSNAPEHAGPPGGPPATPPGQDNRQQSP